jgi:hypothetical protein
MSGGKGGSKTQSTEIPKWLEEPAIRNIARAEDVQRVPYMPWHGPDVAAFNPTQTSAMQQNIGAAEAFGLMPTGSLTAAQGMPTATTYDDGTQGYSGMPLYSQALAELKAKQPDTVSQYDALFGERTDSQGNAIPTYSRQVAQGNNSSYGNYGMGVSSDLDLSSYILEDGSIDWNAAGNPQYGTVDVGGGQDPVGVENPNHPGTGWTGPTGTSDPSGYDAVSDHGGSSSFSGDGGTDSTGATASDYSSYDNPSDSTGPSDW